MHSTLLTQMLRCLWPSTTRWSPPNSDGLTFYACPILGACLPGVNGSRSACAIGYGSIACRYYTGLTTQGNIDLCRGERCAELFLWCVVGTLGSLCADGFFEQFGKCVACPSSHGASVAAMLGMLTLLVVACVVFFRIRHLLPVDVLKLGLSMVQVRECLRNRAVFRVKSVATR